MAARVIHGWRRPRRRPETAAATVPSVFWRRVMVVSAVVSREEKRESREKLRLIAPRALSHHVGGFWLQPAKGSAFKA